MCLHVHIPQLLDQSSIHSNFWFWCHVPPCSHSSSAWSIHSSFEFWCLTHPCYLSISTLKLSRAEFGHTIQIASILMWTQSCINHSCNIYNVGHNKGSNQIALSAPKFSWPIQGKLLYSFTASVRTPKLQNGIAIHGIYSCCDLQNWLPQNDVNSWTAETRNSQAT